MDTPLITVGMPVYNAEDTLETALRSLALQTFANWELIIIDDGSTDGTPDIVRRFANPRVKLIVETRNRGLAVRLNQCIDLARGKYFARMDADDVAYPERFRRQVAYLETHPEIDLLGTDALVFCGPGQALGAMSAAHTHAEICRAPWVGFALPHPTWMGRLAWFKRFRYKESARKAQDQELLLRSYATSRFAALEEPLLGYRSERITMSKGLMGRYHYCRAHIAQVSDAASALRAARALAGHGMRLARDALICTARLQNWVSAHRWGPLPKPRLEAWERLWEEVSPIDHSNPSAKTRCTMHRLCAEIDKTHAD